MQGIDLYLDDDGDDGGHLGDGARVRLCLMVTGADGERSAKEIVLFRFGEPRLLHVYDVLEHGRRYYSSLVYSSCPGRSLQQLAGSGNGVMGALPFLLRPTTPMPSLVITRSLSAAIGQQVFVPGRHLYGLIPQALIEEVSFFRVFLENSACHFGYSKRTAN